MSEEYDNGYSHGYDEGLAECEETKEENIRLRADLAAVTAERDRMREAFEKAANDMRPMLRSMISRNEAAEIVRRAARAALEGESKSEQKEF